MQPSVLITGGAGFIGSHLCDVLLARGFEVTILDRLPVPPPHLDGRARFIPGDAGDADAFEAALKGATHLVHLANTADPAVMLEVLTGRPHVVRRMALASSMSIYGEGGYGPTADGRYVSPPPRTLDQLEARRWEPVLDGEALTPRPTAEHELAQPASAEAVQEALFIEAGKALKIPTVALRLAEVYGSRQAPEGVDAGVAARFIWRLLNDQPPLVFEDGGQRRDFVHVLDVADAFVTVLESDAAAWEACNVGSGRSVTIKEMAEALARLAGKAIAPEVLDAFRVEDARHRLPDTAKIERLFGFTPRWDLEVGLRELVGWARSVHAVQGR